MQAKGPRPTLIMGYGTLQAYTVPYKVGSKSEAPFGSKQRYVIGGRERCGL